MEYLGYKMGSSDKLLGGRLLVQVIGDAIVGNEQIGLDPFAFLGNVDVNQVELVRTGATQVKR